MHLFASGLLRFDTIAKILLVFKTLYKISRGSLDNDPPLKIRCLKK